MSDLLLEATGIFKGYGRIEVLKDVNLTIARGESHVVIGPNGAGKSTLFKVLSGELFPTRGSVRFEGKDVTRVPEWRRTQQGFGRTFQVAHVFGEMSVRENMVVAVEAAERARGRWTPPWRIAPGAQVEARVHTLLADVGLESRPDARASELAYGDRKRLELGMTLALEPRLLLLDEPTAGMSQSDRRASVELIQKVTKSRGLSLLLTEHDMGVVFGLATRLTVLHQGEIIATGEPNAVRNDPRVREVYLGQE